LAKNWEIERHKNRAAVAGEGERLARVSEIPTSRAKLIWQSNGLLLADLARGESITDQKVSIK
jgi:hypothetical protein